MTNENLEAARIAWVDATTRAATLAQADADASAKLRAAITRRENIIDDMAAGHNLGKIDLVQAENTIRQRETESTVAEALARAGKRQVDEAQVAFLQAKVKDFSARLAVAEGRVLSSAQRLDRSLAKAKDNADDLASAERDRAAIAAEQIQFNREVEALTTSAGGQRVNQCLAAQHKSQWPLVRSGHNAAGAHQLPVLKVELVRSEHTFRPAYSGSVDTVVATTAEEFVIAHGIIPPVPSTEVSEAA